MRRLTTLLAAGGLALSVTLAACGTSPTAGPSRGSSSSSSSSGAPGSTGSSSSTAPGSTSSTTSPVGTSAVLGTVLTQASGAEHLALATYQAVIGALGSIAPFDNVASSEQQHVTAIAQLASEYGVSLPTTAVSPPAAPSTKTAACQLGVDTEHRVIALYDTLLPRVGAYPDVTRVFTTLRSAAQDSHLPAFEQCA